MVIFKKNALFLVFSLFLSLFIFSNGMIKEKRKILGASYSIDIPSTPPNVIKLLAGEFSGIIADYLLLQIGSYIGSNSEISQDQWKIIHLGFEQAFELDPYFQQTYFQAQAFLAWDANMPESAIRILEAAGRKRTWDWRPGYYAGFDYYYFLNDFNTASDIYLKTAKIKNAPVLLALLGSRFAIKDKRTEASIAVLKLMLKDNDLNKNDKKEISDRITILKSIEVLDKAIQQFKKIFLVYPSTLDELVYYQILKQLPENPYSKKYTYNPDTGEIKFD
ncbi:MAG: hypothetical protein A2097_05895 [Desulfobacula sp. GWF2_41_7]|nr:MAG: hypothetical protein A2097_05895 [Desulfobacula sp. GWF2_41_7]